MCPLHGLQIVDAHRGCLIFEGFLSGLPYKGGDLGEAGHRNGPNAHSISYLVNHFSISWRF